MGWIRRTYNWMCQKTCSRYGVVWLAFFFFIEASFFIVPVDPILILFCIKDSRRSFFYATIATLSSVIGGVFGYFIGSVLWSSIGPFFLKWIISQEVFDSAVAKYRFYQNWAVLIAGFTPIPYKAVTITAGFCRLPIAPFIMYSLIARAARFYLVAGATWMWGPQIEGFIDRYFNYLVVAFAGLVIVCAGALR